jgi:cytochrome c oxidase subunit 2
VQLTNGQPVQVDDAYIRESILNPNAKTVAGYHADVMPSFQGQISEEGILQLIVYIKSLGTTNAPGAPTAALAPRQDGGKQ